MYGEKDQRENAYDMPTSIQQPELPRIIENLQDVINVYDNIVHETRGKLQTIKRFDEHKNNGGDVKEAQSQCALDEVNRLIYQLRNLNNIAQSNLSHLREIV